MTPEERHLKFIRAGLCSLGLVPTPSDEKLRAWICGALRGDVLSFRRAVEAVAERRPGSFRIPRAWTMAGGEGTVRISPSTLENSDD